MTATILSYASAFAMLIGTLWFIIGNGLEKTPPRARESRSRVSSKCREGVE